MKSAILKLTLPLGVLAFCFCLAMAFTSEDLMLSKLCSGLALIILLYLSAHFSKQNKQHATNSGEY
jgi:Sec-independent protein secretion pathway component TatC